VNKKREDELTRNRTLEEDKKFVNQQKKHNLEQQNSSSKKIERYNATWIFVCYDEDKNEYYVQDEKLNTRNGGRTFNAFCLTTYRGNGYMTDKSIVAVSSYVEYDKINKTFEVEWENIYYASAPSKTNYNLGSGGKQNIPQGSVIDYEYKALLKLLK